MFSLLAFFAGRLGRESFVPASFLSNLRSSSWLVALRLPLALALSFVEDEKERPCDGAALGLDVAVSSLDEVGMCSVRFGSGGKPLSSNPQDVKRHYHGR